MEPVLNLNLASLTLLLSDLVRLVWLDDFLPQLREVVLRLPELHEPDVEPLDKGDKWIEVRGEGIKQAKVGIDSDFTIDYSGADKGSLSIESRGPAKLDLTCAYSKINLDLYTLSIIQAMTKVESTYPTKQRCQVTIRSVELQLKQLLVNTPFQILVFYDNVQIDGSPFTINIEPNAPKHELVKCYGPGISSSRVNQTSQVFVDFTEAGLGELSLLVEGPSRADVKFSQEKYGVSKINYVISTAGDYKFFIKLDNENVKDSPFLINVK